MVALGFHVVFFVPLRFHQILFNCHIDWCACMRVCACLFGGGVAGMQIEAIRHKLILLVKKINVNCKRRWLHVRPDGRKMTIILWPCW